MRAQGRAPVAGAAVAGRVLALLTIALVGAAVHASTAGPRDIDWRTSPLDLNLRGLNGEQFLFRCPPGKPEPDLLVGDRVYADGSSICTAAVHAGLLRPAAGGLVSIEIRPGRSGYRSSDRHFVASRAYEGSWGGSFVVRPAGRPAAPATAATEATPR